VSASFCCVLLRETASLVPAVPSFGVVERQAVPSFGVVERQRLPSFGVVSALLRVCFRCNKNYAGWSFVFSRVFFCAAGAPVRSCRAEVLVPQGGRGSREACAGSVLHVTLIPAAAE
jgi:hypothetical protein